MGRYLLIAAFSYLLGSIPFGYVLVRLVQGQDIRRRGSGNIGATNVARSYPGLGVLTLVLDATKGALAVYLAILLAQQSQPLPISKYLAMCLAALFAVAGHIFPVWLTFRGGKGVATAVGAFLLVAPEAIVGALVLFLLVVVATRYISLGSVVSAAIFPLLAWVFYRNSLSAPLILIIAIASALVVIRHRQNIGRLIAGTEPRFQLRQR
jgi:acyl phosphate:glycerol-3-phosphate acyltransferase